MKLLELESGQNQVGKFYFIKNDKSVITDQISKGELYQPWIVEWANSTIKPGTTVLDIGANIGCFTIPFSQKTGNKGFVHSFEPQTVISQILTTNVIMNGLPNVKVHNIGLSNINGTGKLNTYDPLMKESFQSGASSLAQKLNNSIREVVEVRTLDSFNLRNVSFMKIDVQDYEFQVLQGAKKTIAENKPAIVVELMYRTPEEKEYSKKCTNLLIKYGYKLKKRTRKDHLFLPNNNKQVKISKELPKAELDTEPKYHQEEAQPVEDIEEVPLDERCCPMCQRDLD